MELSLIQNKIYAIRNQRVILDRDLSEMYGMDSYRKNIIMGVITMA